MCRPDPHAPRYAKRFPIVSGCWAFPNDCGSIFRATAGVWLNSAAVPGRCSAPISIKPQFATVRCPALPWPGIPLMTSSRSIPICMSLPRTGVLASIRFSGSAPHLRRLCWRDFLATRCSKCSKKKARSPRLLSRHVGLVLHWFYRLRRQAHQARQRQSVGRFIAVCHSGLLFSGAHFLQAGPNPPIVNKDFIRAEPTQIVCDDHFHNYQRWITGSSFTFRAISLHVWKLTLPVCRVYKHTESYGMCGILKK
jgi:hypothetical protein